ncbi:tetratricopeptide repeat protein [Leptolyngbya cf. ectocarpi LEGE 11479]|uniref:Tetratricopeptide repeat protein n=1 Tax=Leptolyngbya cf. ectocarpi LEGE 11479 TaxID=1828722 RepID=A0A928X4M5_LEPEC|nr:tetratricopeptide repeat protein [Leptolyngbya ectocarpi]MBE9067143.1 tetratricopeptide repeat protein [Leptolyngbya cf. ectocarpi LEGE 11479]
MVATQLRSRQVLGLNQRQYEGLKTSLQLNLRRQLLIAVCDSDTLQTQLVERLRSELTAGDKGLDDFGKVALEQLTFDPSQPDLVVQLVHWLKRAPKPTPHVQVVGIGAMTHQSMRSQNHFLRSLESIQSLLPYLDSSLVLWVSWPWYRTLEQAAPEFWQWRSGVFTFVSEPVTGEPAAIPLADGLDGLYGEANTKAPSADIWQILSEDLAQLERSSAAAESADEGTVSEDSADSPADILADPPDIPASPLTIAPTAPSAQSVDVTTLDNPLEAIAQLEHQGASPEKITQAYRTLGHHYRDRIEAGDLTPNLLATAIETFELYLKWLPAEDDQRAAGLNDLGTLHWLQAQHQSDRATLIAGMNQSANIYKTALAGANVDPETSSRLHGNLGAVYSSLANYDDSVNHLKAAVTAYRHALPFCSSDTSPDEYGTLQNSLGSVYWKLAYYEQPKPHLHRAIAAYNEALRCHHPETSPLDYAAVQNNLGIAYWSLSRHERPIFLLKHAIAAYSDALNYRTPSTDAAACASTYNNLGTAFWELANHPDAPADPEGHYKQNAVIAYEAAIKASELAPSSLDLTSIHHCLGSIYDKMARAADSQTEHQTERQTDIVGKLARALEHYVAALKATSKTATTYEPIFKALVRNVSAHYEFLGLEGQKQALNKIPAQILPEVMLKL